jgi:uncharacterized protein YdeI (YjbR/CyaY-like superfamily)
MQRDPRIDAYIVKAQPFARSILERAREVIHRALPDIEEGIKWGAPAFMLNGKNVAGLAAFKRHAAIMLTADDTAGGGMGSYGKLASLDDLPSEAELTRRLHFARDMLAGGKALRDIPERAPKQTIPVPQDFAAALGEAPKAKATFDGFTDAQRRDYLEWITGAKREETRAKRIGQAVEWLAEGKRRNWKYEKC